LGLEFGIIVDDTSIDEKPALWDTYSFPGFRPEPTVRGIFGDPKARVITSSDAQKKRRAAVAVAPRWLVRPQGPPCAHLSCGERGYIWNSRCGGLIVAVVAR